STRMSPSLTPNWLLPAPYLVLCARIVSLPSDSSCFMVSLRVMVVIGYARWFAVPEPRRGGLIIAQGKAAEAAALGKWPSHPGNYFASATQSGAAFALGYYHVVPPGLQSGALRSHGRITQKVSGAGPLIIDNRRSKSGIGCTGFIRRLHKSL